MAIKQILIRGVNLKWIMLATFYPFVCWALWQDMKTQLPWYFIALACLFGGAFGLFMIIKIVEPTMRYMNSKIAKLLHIKE